MIDQKNTVLTDFILDEIILGKIKNPTETINTKALAEPMANFK